MKRWQSKKKGRLNKPPLLGKVPTKILKKGSKPIARRGYRQLRWRAGGEKKGFDQGAKSLERRATGRE